MVPRNRDRCWVGFTPVPSSHQKVLPNPPLRPSKEDETLRDALTARSLEDPTGTHKVNSPVGNPNFQSGGEP